MIYDPAESRLPTVHCAAILSRLVWLRVTDCAAAPQCNYDKAMCSMVLALTLSCLNLASAEANSRYSNRSTHAPYGNFELTRTHVQVFDTHVIIFV
jgi:hypothetical protein